MKSRTILTPKDSDRDPQDARRRDDLRRNFQTREHQVFTATPSVKQLREGERIVQDDDGTIYSLVKYNGKLYRVELTEVT